MLNRLRILGITIFSSFFLLLMLCLGAQNLNNRHALKIGFTTTAPLPIGFLIGASIALGVLNGGTAAAFLLPSNNSLGNEST